MTCYIDGQIQLLNIAINCSRSKLINIKYSLAHSDFAVKKTTLNVLTHLVLNDMVKIKTELSDIGVLLSDTDMRIQNLARLFFQELYKKDNKIIYNILPEIINKMSKENKPEAFHRFI